MTPEAAIQEFFEQFGMEAYAATEVPSDAEFPYLTYDLVEGEWMQPEVNMPVNLWFRTNSEKKPNAKVREIGKVLGNGGTLVKCDGGTLWLKKGSPWAQAVREESDDNTIKRRYVNVNVEYLTAS
ncbi:MAG: hypothetical protein IJ111_01220 [Eggerthellaceae bacterium]|nr:hypothetical protein [Eggerthellaceae bacterium]